MSAARSLSSRARTAAPGENGGGCLVLLLLLLLLEGETSAHEAAEGEVGSVFLFFCLVWVGGGGERE